MEKLLTKELLLDVTFNYLRSTSDFELYSFEEKKQYLKCLREIKSEIKKLQDIILENNLDTFVLIEQPDITIKEHINIIKQYIIEKTGNINNFQIFNNISYTEINLK